MSSGAGSGNLLLLLLPMLLLGFLMWTQRRRSRALQDVQASLQVGEEVMTSSGMYGRIVALDDAIATLEVAPGVHVRYDRRAIIRPDRPSAASGTEQPAGEG